MAVKHKLTRRDLSRTDSRPTTSGDRPAFNAFAGHVVGSLVAFNTMLGSMTDEQLDLFIEQTSSLGTTNCWVFEYALRDVLLKLAHEERAHRKQVGAQS